MLVFVHFNLKDFTNQLIKTSSFPSNNLFTFGFSQGNNFYVLAFEPDSYI
jgi:predicted esterase